MNTSRMGRLVAPVLAVILGLYLLLFPWSATNNLCRLLGWVVLIAGICGMIAAFTTYQGTSMKVPAIAGSAVALVLGFVLIGQPWVLVNFINFLMYLFLLAEGIAAVRGGLLRKDLGDPAWWLPLVIGVLCIVMAVSAFFTPWATNTIMRLVGLMMLAGGISNLVQSIKN